MFRNAQLSRMDWNSYFQLFWQVFHCLKGFFSDELNRLSEPPTTSADVTKSHLHNRSAGMTTSSELYKSSILLDT